MWLIVSCVEPQSLQLILMTVGCWLEFKIPRILTSSNGLIPVIYEKNLKNHPLREHASLWSRFCLEGGTISWTSFWHDDILYSLKDDQMNLFVEKSDMAVIQKSDPKFSPVPTLNCIKDDKYLRRQLNLFRFILSH